MRTDRSWMYNRRISTTRLNDKFIAGVYEFVAYVLTQKMHVSEGHKIRCPCLKCDNLKFHDTEIVKVHLYRHGFVPRYESWSFHGEPLDTPNLNPKVEVAEVSEPPKYDAKNSYATTEKPLYESCKKQPPLSAVSKLLKIKSEFNLSENCYNRILQFVKELLPNEANFPNESSKTPEETLKHFEKTNRVDTSSQPFLMTTRKKKKTENCVAVEETSENNLKDNISDTSNTGVNTTNNLGS